MQLLLPPGLPHNGGASGRRSLWEMNSYLHLINRIVFGEAQSSASHRKQAVYAADAGYLVDFTGGTAGRNASYKDAMEIKLEKQNRGSSKSNVSVYFAKGTGAVALEFRETGSVGGTFKMYIGKKYDQ